MKHLILALLITGIISASVYAQNPEPSDSLARKLQEIVVTAKQPATKLIGSTLVSTIVGSSLQNLGTAIDVLAQLPMIKTEDGVVTVIGKGSPEIFIDGRPMRDSDELQQLHSDNIKKVELLMAPGAMYASTTKAVLKITTRHNFIDGLSFTDRAEVTARRKWSVNNLLDLNYRAGNFDFFATGTLANNNSLIKGTTSNTLEYNGRMTMVGSSQYNEYPSTTGIIKAGFNFTSGKQSFGGYYRFNPERAKFTNTGTEWLNDEPQARRMIDRDIRAHSHLFSMYYDNAFNDKYHLHFDGDFRSSKSDNGVRTSYPDRISADVNSTENKMSTLWAGKLYLEFPLWGGNVSIGTQDSYTHTSLNYIMHNGTIGEYIPSSLTDTRQTSASVFTSWHRMWRNFSLSAGVRYEYVDYIYKINGKKDNNVSRQDNFLTPDISLGYSFNEKSQVSLSYKMITVKPPYSQLTGSLNYVGIHEIEGGNQTLHDERKHDIQFFGMWNDFMLQSDYIRSLDTYAFVKRLYPAPALQLLMHPENIDVSAISVYLIWNKSIKAWTPEMTIGLYKQWMAIGSQQYNSPVFSYYFDNMISLPKGFMITLNAYGQTSGHMHTSRLGTTWFSLDASVSKSFLSKSLRVKLSATDIFNTRNNDWSMNTYGVIVDKHQSYDRRGVSLSVIYRFNPRQSKYKGKAASETEMNRL